MIELKRFQVNAAEEITKKFIQYIEDPLMKDKTTIIPFYQNLSSITGSGKTLVLAKFLNNINAQLPISPIVLWLSKGKVVVWQTYEKFKNGLYKDNIGKCTIKKILECNKDDVEEYDDPLMLIATVAKFNQKDMEKSDRKIFEIQLDKASDSLWNLLKRRKTKNNIKRPLIIIYDEGHNLSDQQTDLLIDDLKPEALITASATMRLPKNMEKIINRLKEDKGWTDNELITSVRSSEVVKSQLIKKGIELNAYNTSMEIAIDDMLAKMQNINCLIDTEKLNIRPKAIYVTNTNTIINTKYNDKLDVEFNERQARPIVIWRYLVSKGIEPEEIAVYCNLKFDKDFPPPKSFNLFSGGDNDYDNFIKGNYKHIIFNLSLQEGWDDPECYFAYIDKDMGSKVQISQVVGRVLRQPGVTHYKKQELNISYFYIRSDEKNIFKDVIEEIEEKIAKDIPELDITYSSSSGKSNKIKVKARKTEYLPEIAVDRNDSMKKIKNIVNDIPDFRFDKVNINGNGSRIQVVKYIGDENNNKEQWININNTNKVSARWIFINELEKYYKNLKNICDIEDEKFDAMIGYNSKAANIIREYAIKVVDAYIKYSRIVVMHCNSRVVDDITVNKEQFKRFKNSIHEGYSGFNKLEKNFADELDKLGVPWLRNQDSNYFEIPLLDKDDTNNFNPDFIVWSNNKIVAMDTKGDHIIQKDKERKLFELENIDEGPKVQIRLISEGKFNDIGKKEAKEGFTLWSLRNGRIIPYHFDNLKETIKYSLD